MRLRRRKQTAEPQMIPAYVAPWGGDYSVPGMTLTPWYSYVGEVHPWAGWDWCDGRVAFDGYQTPDLRGFLGVPMWSMCRTGQGVAFGIATMPEPVTGTVTVSPVGATGSTGPTGATGATSPIKALL